MDEDAYIPDSDDLKDWEELVEANRQWNKKTFTLTVRQKPRELDRVRFIEHLRLAIITKIPDYKTKTRREIIEQLDQWYQVREELRRYCDITEQDFESMLDGLTFPYLERAWTSMFHPSILEDMEKNRKAFAEEKDPQPKQEQPVVPQPPTESTTESGCEEDHETIDEGSRCCSTKTCQGTTSCYASTRSSSKT